MRTDTTATNWEEWLDWFSKSDNRLANLDFNQCLRGAAIVFDSIWKERNKIIHEGNSTPIAVTINFINFRLCELIPTRDSCDALQSAWNPPPKGWLACNSDVAIGHSQSAGAVVFRDTSRTILNLLTLRTNHCDPLPGEVAALCEGAVAAVKLGYRNIIFQCDYLNVVTALRSNPAEIHKLHFNIQDKVEHFLSLVENFNLWEVQWIPRTCNGVAHSVAQWASRNNKFGVLDLANFDDFLQSFTADGHGSI
ncbi:hypothetical protein CsatA_010545 [Cannabis sativa]